MDRHLVTVEVGIKGRTDQRMQLDGLALNQDGFEGLDSEAVKGWGAVEHDWMLADDFLEDVPDLGDLLLNELLGSLDGGGHASEFKLIEDERLKELQGHELWQSALMELECWAHHNDGAPRVVDPFAQEVLTETTALALDHVGQ